MESKPSTATSRKSKQYQKGEQMTTDEAVQHYGTQKAVTDAINKTAAAFTSWVNNGFIPAASQFQLHIASKKALKVDEWCLKGYKPPRVEKG